MHGCYKAANHAVRGVITLEYIFDIKSWLSPHLAEIHGHTSPHVFLFQKNSEGVAVMFTKHWSHEDWEPAEGLRLLKVTSYMHCPTARTLLSYVISTCSEYPRRYPNVGRSRSNQSRHSTLAERYCEVCRSWCATTWSQQMVGRLPWWFRAALWQLPRCCFILVPQWTECHPAVINHPLNHPWIFQKRFCPCTKARLSKKVK